MCMHMCVHAFLWCVHNGAPLHGTVCVAIHATHTHCRPPTPMQPTTSRAFAPELAATAAPSEAAMPLAAPSARTTVSTHQPSTSTMTPPAKARTARTPRAAAPTRPQLTLIRLRRRHVLRLLHPAPPQPPRLSCHPTATNSHAQAATPELARASATTPQPPPLRTTSAARITSTAARTLRRPSSTPSPPRCCAPLTCVAASPPSPAAPTAPPRGTSPRQTR